RPGRRAGPAPVYVPRVPSWNTPAASPSPAPCSCFLSSPGSAAHERGRSKGAGAQPLPGPRLSVSFPSCRPGSFSRLLASATAAAPEAHTYTPPGRALGSLSGCVGDSSRA
ncbi:unnamed protein product, partial [Amoebophrya sp. A120]